MSESNAESDPEDKAFDFVMKCTQVVAWSVFAAIWVFVVYWDVTVVAHHGAGALIAAIGIEFLLFPVSLWVVMAVSLPVMWLLGKIRGVEL